MNHLMTPPGIFLLLPQPHDDAMSRAERFATGGPHIAIASASRGAISTGEQISTGGVEVLQGCNLQGNGEAGRVDGLHSHHNSPHSLDSLTLCLTSCPRILGLTFLARATAHTQQRLPSVLVVMPPLAELPQYVLGRVIG